MGGRERRPGYYNTLFSDILFPQILSVPCGMMRAKAGIENTVHLTEDILGHVLRV